MDLRTMTKTPSCATNWLWVLLMLVGVGVSAVTQAGTVTYVYTDAQGTPLAKADANGNIIATFDYAPYGAQALGTPPDGPGYTGHVNDPDTGLVYMQARYYDPAVGRFLSVDPVSPAPGNLFNFNRYDYTSNNPYSFIDPDGRRDIYIGGAADKGRTRIVQDYAGAQQQLNPGRDVQYFSYREKAEIAAAISAPLKEGEPLNVIGHSLGGREAIRQANSTEAEITNLVTIDPVGSAGNGAKPPNIEAWTNVLAVPLDRNSSDTVASAGRMVFGSTATSGADSQTQNTSHGDFPSMMSNSDAQRKVDASYQERKDRQ